MVPLTVSISVPDFEAELTVPPATLLAERACSCSLLVANHQCLAKPSPAPCSPWYASLPFLGSHIKDSSTTQTTSLPTLELATSDSGTVECWRGDPQASLTLVADCVLVEHKHANVCFVCKRRLPLVRQLFLQTG